MNNRFVTLSLALLLPQVATAQDEVELARQCAQITLLLQEQLAALQAMTDATSAQVQFSHYHKAGEALRQLSREKEKDLIYYIENHPEIKAILSRCLQLTMLELQRLNASQFYGLDELKQQAMFFDVN